MDIARDGVAERVPGRRAPEEDPPAPQTQPTTQPSSSRASGTSPAGTRVAAAVGSPAPVDRRRQVAAHSAWAVPALAMLALGLYGLTSAGMWSDELVTWGISQLSWADFRALSTKFDTALMPYYLLMRGWVALVGDSDAALRLPSVLAAAGAAGLVGRLGTRMVNPLAGLFAGLLFVAVPSITRYAHEARPYTLAVFGATLATLALVRLAEKPSFWRVAAYAGAVTLIALSHLIALAVVLAHGAWLATSRRDVLVRWAIGAIVGALPVAPLLWFGSDQRNNIGWIANSDYRILSVFLSGLFGTMSAATVLVVLGLLGISRAAKVQPYVFWAVVPAAALYLVSLVSVSVWLPRYVMFVIPAWALLAAAALVRMRIPAAVAAILVIAAVGIPIHKQWREPGGHNVASREAATIISERYQPGDVIVYATSGSGQLLAPRDMIDHYVPADRRPREPLLVRPARTKGRVAPDLCRDVIGCLKKPERIWIVRVGAPQNPLSGFGPDYDQVLRNYVMQQRWNPRGLTIALLTTDPS